jgi:RNA polymerase sigma-70 factor (ECF subfamily)
MLSTVRSLLANQSAFLGFLERRVGDRATAEDLLQAALERSLDQMQSLRDEESVIAGFYRMLRNAVIDHLVASPVQILEQYPPTGCCG